MTISYAQVVVDGVRTVGWGKMKGVERHNGARSSNLKKLVVDIITEQEESSRTKTIETGECTYDR